MGPATMGSEHLVPGQGFVTLNIPEVQDLTGNNTRLGRLPFWQVVQEEFAVTDYCISPLPSFLHTRGLWDLQTNREHVYPGP